jgi:hypothetical protein
MEALSFVRPLVFWSNVLLFPILTLNLLSACAVLLSKRLIRDFCVLGMLLIVTYYLLISGGPNALGRSRHPAMPIISILGGYGISHIVAARFHRSWYFYGKLSSRDETKIQQR